MNNSISTGVRLVTSEIEPDPRASIQAVSDRTASKELNAALIAMAVLPTELMSHARESFAPATPRGSQFLYKSGNCTLVALAARKNGINGWGGHGEPTPHLERTELTV